jgi:hypothetical protein
MTLTNNQRLRSVSINGDFEAVVDVDLATTVPEAIPMTLSIDTATFETSDWTLSEAAEDRGVAGALDGQDGIIYSGPAGGAVRVKVTNLDVDEESIIANAADACTAAIYLNSEVVAYADEGFVAELDITAEFNMDTYIGGLQTGDVIRVGIVAASGSEAAWEAGVAEGGTIDIV